MFRRSAPRPEITRDAVSAIIVKLMEMDEKLNEIIEFMEIDDGEEED